MSLMASKRLGVYSSASLPNINFAGRQVSCPQRRGRLVSNKCLLDSIGHMLTTAETKVMEKNPSQEFVYFYMRPTESVLKQREEDYQEHSMAEKRFSLASPGNPTTMQGIGPPMRRYKAISGDHIDFRFEVVRELSRGRFSVVISAVDHAAAQVKNMKVAIQVMNSTDAASRRFNRTLNLLTQLRDESLGDEPNSESSHLAHFRMGYQTMDGWRCLVFRRNESSLAKSIMRGRPYPIAATKSVVRGLLKALAYLHRLGVVQAGVAKHNVFIDTHEFSNDGSYNWLGEIRAVLGGFGNSRFVDCIRNLDGNDRSQRSYVQDLSFLNPFGTRSPEVILNYDGQIDTPSDLWCLGILTTELIRGVPFVKLEYSSSDGYKDVQELAAVESQLGSIAAAMGGDLRHAELTRRHLSMLSNARACASRKPTSRGIFSDSQFQVAGNEWAADFVAKVLTINPMVRATADDLLRHAYVM